MARDTCGATRDGLTCDRGPGHAGDHRGYLEAVDEVLFWPTEERELEELERRIGAMLDRLELNPPARALVAARLRLAACRPTSRARS